MLALLPVKHSSRANRLHSHNLARTVSSRSLLRCSNNLSRHPRCSRRLVSCSRKSTHTHTHRMLYSVYVLVCSRHRISLPDVAPVRLSLYTHHDEPPSSHRWNSPQNYHHIVPNHHTKTSPPVSGTSA
uniref:(northern house mosquito) hypothetical protein n=1 Tax=Culex pipiens TaxID=7175 RepID=A0A8D8HEI2_CULPI